MAREDLRKYTCNNLFADKDGQGYLSYENLNLGCLLRIADATELMAKRYQDLIDDRDRARRLYASAVGERDRVYRSRASLRGQITKLKKQIAQLRGGCR